MNLVTLPLLVMALTSYHALAISPSAEPDTKIYSYLCLAGDSTLCMGISPGDSDPVFDKNAPFYLQLKSRPRGEESMTDYRKTRWDIFYGQGKVALSRFSDLCATKLASSDQAGLFPCNVTFPRSYRPNINYGRWSLGALRTDANGAAPLMLAGNQNLCLTPMRCDRTNMDEEWCNPMSSQVAWSNFTNAPVDLRRGVYLKFRPCWNRPGGNPGWRAIQRFRVESDCAPGCPVFLQNNDQCEPACNNAACNWDNGKCNTKSPTTLPPGATPRPTTRTPTTLAPTNRPTPPTTLRPTPPTITTGAPTRSPQVACPATLDQCSRISTKKRCKKARSACTWCTGACRPRSEPRSCTVPGILDHCPVPCPPVAAFTKCLPNLRRKKCSRGPCVYCGNSRTCRPGKDLRVCGRPDVYATCPRA